VRGGRTWCAADVCSAVGSRQLRGRGTRCSDYGRPRRHSCGLRGERRSKAGVAVAHVPGGGGGVECAGSELPGVRATGDGGGSVERSGGQGGEARAVGG
jgi:hypothetical protein